MSIAATIGAGLAFLVARYGLRGDGLRTSWICMLPGTAADTFAGGRALRGGGDLRRTLSSLAIAGVLILLVSLIPRFLQRRSQAAGELLRSVVAVLAAGGLLANGAEPVAAFDSAAYDRLLKTHVRPGTVNGIRLNLVDYAAVKAQARP